MASLKEILAYLCQNYPGGKGLSRRRLTWMVYLADWKAALQSEERLTTISWRFTENGPNTEDIVKLIMSDPDFEIRSIMNKPHDIIIYRGCSDFTDLSERDKQILDFVIQKSAIKNSVEFTKLVYSTFPILTRPRYAKLNLVTLAKEYRDGSCWFDDTSEACHQAGG
jgi:hypothetical protein